MDHKQNQGAGDVQHHFLLYLQDMQTTLYALAVDLEMPVEPLCMSIWKHEL